MSNIKKYMRFEISETAEEINLAGDRGQELKVE
jgi:hypothetical protein